VLAVLPLSVRSAPALALTLGLAVVPTVADATGCCLSPHAESANGAITAATTTAISECRMLTILVPRSEVCGDILPHGCNTRSHPGG
jgi:hypothetical protein